MFHSDRGANVSVTNCISHFSMFVPTNATVKLANGKTGHAQGIWIILCHYPNCSIIYIVGPVYYCPGHPSNTISSGSLIFYVCFKRLHLNLLNIVTLLTLKVVLGDHHTRLKKSWISSNRNFQGKPSHRQQYFCPNCLWSLKTNFISTYSSEFWSCLYYHNKTNDKKMTHGRSP